MTLPHHSCQPQTASLSLTVDAALTASARTVEAASEAVVALAAVRDVIAAGEAPALRAEPSRLRAALEGLADAAEMIVTDDAIAAGAPAPATLLDALDEAERAARAALAEGARCPREGAGVWARLRRVWAALATFVRRVGGAL